MRLFEENSQHSQFLNDHFHHLHHQTRTQKLFDGYCLQCLLRHFNLGSIAHLAFSISPVKMSLYFRLDFLLGQLEQLKEQYLSLECPTQQ